LKPEEQKKIAKKKRAELKRLIEELEELDEVKNQDPKLQEAKSKVKKWQEEARK
jgi:transcriptional/translational regulatory protein YebC/TACO1